MTAIGIGKFAAAPKVGRLAPIVARASAADSSVIPCVVSDGSIDRNGNKVLPTAWDLKHAKKGCPLLWDGDTSSIESVLGGMTNIRIEGSRLLADAEFMSGDVNPAAGCVLEMFRGGFLRAFQAEYSVREYSRSTDKLRPGGLDFTKVELLAVSVVTLPINPNALAEARAAGLDLRPLADLASRALTRKDLPEMARRDYELIQRAATAAVRAAPRPATVPASPASARWPGGLGEFLCAVAKTADGAAELDARLIRSPSGLSENDPPGGGFLVDFDFLPGIVEPIFDGAALVAPWLRRFRMQKPSASIPGVDETSRQNGSRWGGVASTWLAEGTTIPASFARFKNVEFVAHKIAALLVATREIMADVSMFSEWARAAFTADLSFRIDSAIISGTGAGQPLGLLNTPALITIPKDNGQATKTITQSNIENMWAALPVNSRRRAIWIAHENVEAQLSTVLPPGLSPSQAAIYMPQGTAGTEDWPRLKGRPLVVVEQANPVGTPGDLLLIDPTTYAVAAMDSRLDISAEVDWTSDQVLLRLIWRVDGRPLYTSAITSFSDVTLRSPYIALAQR